MTLAPPAWPFEAANYIVDFQINSGQCFGSKKRFNGTLILLSRCTFETKHHKVTY